MREYRFECDISYTKPLLIFGRSGSGKSTYARQIVKDRVITTIDTTYLRDMRRLTETLGNLRKHNITQMLSENKPRGVIFDDIHVFYKQDQRGFAKICEVIAKPPKYAWIIVVSDISYKTKKKIAKLPCEIHVFELNLSQRYKLCKHVLAENDKKLESDKIDQLIHETTGVRQLIERINGYTNEIGETPETLSHKSSEALNILDNLGTILNVSERHRYLSYVYRLHVFFDQTETFVNIYNYWDIIVYPRVINDYIKQCLQDTHTIIHKGNRYISKSLVVVSRERMFPDISPETHSQLYQYFCGLALQPPQSFNAKQLKVLKDMYRDIS